MGKRSSIWDITEDDQKLLNDHYMSEFVTGKASSLMDLGGIKKDKKKKKNKSFKELEDLGISGKVAKQVIHDSRYKVNKNGYDYSAVDYIDLSNEEDPDSYDFDAIDFDNLDSGIYMEPEIPDEQGVSDQVNINIDNFNEPDNTSDISQEIDDSDIIVNPEISFVLNYEVGRLNINDGIVANSYNIEYGICNEEIDTSAVGELNKNTNEIIEAIIDYIITLKHPTAILTNDEIANMLTGIEGFNDDKFRVIPLSDKSEYAFCYKFDRSGVKETIDFVLTLIKERMENGSLDGISIWESKLLAVFKDIGFMCGDNHACYRGSRDETDFNIYLTSDYNHREYFINALQNDPETRYFQIDGGDGGFNFKTLEAIQTEAHDILYKLEGEDSAYDFSSDLDDYDEEYDEYDEEEFEEIIPVPENKEDTNVGSSDANNKNDSYVDIEAANIEDIDIDDIDTSEDNSVVEEPKVDQNPEASKGNDTTPITVITADKNNVGDMVVNVVGGKDPEKETEPIIIQRK